MGTEPNLAALRSAFGSNHPEVIDKFALAGGLALMAVALLRLFNDPMWSYYNIDGGMYLIALAIPPIGFFIGSMAIYILYCGAKTALWVTKHFWWVFALAFVGFLYFNVK